MYEFLFVTGYYHWYDLTQPKNIPTKYWYTILVEILIIPHLKMVSTVVLAVLFWSCCTTNYYRFKRSWRNYELIALPKTIHTTNYKNYSHNSYCWLLFMLFKLLQCDNLRLLTFRYRALSEQSQISKQNISYCSIDVYYIFILQYLSPPKLISPWIVEDFWYWFGVKRA